MVSLKLNHIGKSFPGVKALHDISFDVHTGEVHALCGENGAGKSTLMNILSGNLKPDQGTFQLNGETLSFSNPKEAFAKGIAIVHQHLSLVDNLSIAENIFANQHPLNRFGFIQYKKLYQQTSHVLNELEISLSPTALVSSLSPAQKQMVEIAKALAKNPQVLILDEPTASLTDKEIKVLFSIIHNLKQRGVSILYISHRLVEIFQLADRITILKDGTYQGTFAKEDITKEDLIKKMVGREISTSTSTALNNSQVLLEVKNLCGGKFNDINFTLHRGEILGVAGLVGAGRTEIARALFGADQKTKGEVLKENIPLTIHHPADAIRNRMAYVSEDRKVLGLFQEMSIEENIIASSLALNNDYAFFDKVKSNQQAEEVSKQLRIVSQNINQKVAQLSGGNQQKVLLGKWLSVQPDILIVDEPTHGVDVGAKQEIYTLLKKLASDGMGIIMISSELPELLGLCHRILVIHEGRLNGELSSEAATEEKILSLAAN